MLREYGLLSIYYQFKHSKLLVLLGMKSSSGKRGGLRVNSQIIKDRVSCGKEFELDLRMVGNRLKVLGRLLWLCFEA